MNIEWTTIATYLGPIALTLAAGKTLKRLVLLPFEYLRNKSRSKVVDVLVSQAEQDLGIDKPTIPDEVQ